MIDINLMAEDFDAELNKVRELNNEKRKIKLQESDAGVNAERLRAFLQELTALSDKYGIYINGSRCFGSTWLNDLQAGKIYDNFTYGKDRYEVDG